MNRILNYGTNNNTSNNHEYKNNKCNKIGYV